MVLSAPAISIQVGLLFHAAVVITALKLSAKLGTCDCAMKPACSAERSAAKYSYLDPAQFHEVTWEALSVVSLIFSSVGHVGRDIHQADNRWIRPRFRNYGSSVAVSNKNARPIL
jgi:hypothetical protein